MLVMKLRVRKTMVAERANENLTLNEGISEKVAFGCDYVQFVVEIGLRGQEGFDGKVHALRGLFLLQFGLSVEEIDGSTRLFFKRMQGETLDNLNSCVQRLKAYVEGKQELKELMLTQFAVMASLADEITEAQRALVNAFAESLDFRPSEINALYAKATGLRAALVIFANEWGK